MTDQQRLDEIRARTEKATPEPWSFHAGDLWCGATADEIQHADDIYASGVAYSDEAEDILMRANHLFHGDPVRAEDAAFIAAARSDVPYLLSLAESLQADNERLQRAVDAVQGVLDRDDLLITYNARANLIEAVKGASPCS